MKETRAEDIDYYAVSIVGPRNRVAEIVGPDALSTVAKVTLL
ncbi:hypothetical protein [Nonomuraea turcica]|nr:hypothetical protein [Nonomuraea sp. G32]MDP4510741.1 hypothetical protein [Nonomuraea sp. G32]